LTDSAVEFSILWEIPVRSIWCYYFKLQVSVCDKEKAANYSIFK